MPKDPIKFGIKAKSLTIFTIVFVLIVAFNGYLSVQSLQLAKATTEQVGNKVLLAQGQRGYRAFTDAQTQTIELLIKSIEDDVTTLSQFTTRVFNTPELFNTDKFWNKDENLTHLANNQLVENASHNSTLWSPTWMKVEPQVIAKIEKSAFLSEHFEPILQRNPNTVANYFLATEGFVRYFPRINMLSTFSPDHRTVDDIYFAPANEKNNPEKQLVWTPLYQDPAGKGLMVSALAPIYQGKEFIGVVGTDITLRKLVDSYIKHDQTNGNFAMLLDQNFRPIALSNKAVATLYGKNLAMDKSQVPLSLLDYDSPFKSTFNKMKNQNSGFEKVTVGDKTYFISFSKNNRLQWYYADVIDEHHLLNATNRVNRALDNLGQKSYLNFALPTILFYLILLVSMIFVLNHLLSPIRALSKISKIIADGQTDHPIEVRATDEIAQLVENFKVMQRALVKQQQSLEQFNSTLQQKVDTRNAELENAYTELLQANKKVSQSAADMTLLSKLGRELTATLDLQSVFDKTYQSLNDVIETHAFTVGFVDFEKGIINTPLVVEEQQKLPPFTLQLDDINRPAVWCVLNRKEILLFDRDDDKKYFKEPTKEPIVGKRHRTVVYQPLMIGDELIGCLSLQNLKAHAFDDHQIELIRIMADYLAIALANALGYSKLEKTHDELLKTQQQLVLQEKMASLGNLTSGVAHELSNPANFVRIGAHNLSNDLAELKQHIFQLAGENAEQALLESLENKFSPFAGHIGSIEKGSLRIKAIVDDLRAFTNIQDCDIAQMNLSAAVTAAVNTVQQQNSHSEIEFKIAVPEHINLNCKRVQINQVLVKLLQNAVDAIKQRPSEKQQTQGVIRITAETTDRGIVLTIQDNGIGMDETTQRKIFEPFYTTKTNGATGLGLTVSFAIIENHQGHISVKSTFGKGSELTIVLPSQ